MPPCSTSRTVVPALNGPFSANDSPFNSLPIDRNLIRKVKVLPNLDGDGLIQCSLKCSRSGTSYLPLSYECGCGPESCWIRLNEVKFRVKDNLHQFLCFARLNRHGQWLWIDALCINQQDHREKARQIALMHRIYTGSRAVLSFIPTTNSSSRHKLNRTRQVEMAWVFMQKASGANHASKLAQARRRTGIMQGVLQIAKSSYWSRLWIVQEVVHAKDVLITDGRHQVRWTDFHAVLQLAMESPHLRKPGTRDPISMPIVLQELRSGKWSSPLANLLDDFASSKCGKFHDRTYALASLAINGHRLRVDYSLTQARHFLQAIEFCRGPGAYLPQDSELFSLGRKLMQAMKLDLQLLKDSILKQDVLACDSLEAHVLSDRFGRPFYTCDSCGARLNLPRHHQQYSLLCLDIEGSSSHLLSRQVYGLWLESSLVLPSSETSDDFTDPGTVTIALEPKSTKPYVRVWLTTASFYRLLQLEKYSPGLRLPRTLELCMISAEDPDMDNDRENVSGCKARATFKEVRSGRRICDKVTRDLCEKR